LPDLETDVQLLPHHDEFYKTNKEMLSDECRGILHQLKKAAVQAMQQVRQSGVCLIQTLVYEAVEVLAKDTKGMKEMFQEALVKQAADPGFELFQNVHVDDVKFEKTI
jgi:hypothetical protein